MSCLVTVENVQRFATGLQVTIWDPLHKTYFQKSGWCQFHLCASNSEIHYMTKIMWTSLSPTFVSFQSNFLHGQIYGFYNHNVWTDGAVTTQVLTLNVHTELVVSVGNSNKVSLKQYGPVPKNQSSSKIRQKDRRRIRRRRIVAGRIWRSVFSVTKSSFTSIIAQYGSKCSHNN